MRHTAKKEALARMNNSSNAQCRPFTFLQKIFETRLHSSWGGLVLEGWGRDGCGMGQLRGSSMSEAMEALPVRCSSPCCGPVLRGAGRSPHAGLCMAALGACAP